MELKLLSTYGDCVKPHFRNVGNHKLSRCSGLRAIIFPLKFRFFFLSLYTFQRTISRTISKMTCSGNCKKVYDHISMTTSKQSQLFRYSGTMSTLSNDMC